MTKLRIVGRPIGEALPQYRGVDRPPPPPVGPNGRATAAERTFAWYVEHVGQDGTIEDLASAISLVDAYAKLTPPIVLQVVETAAVGEATRPGHVFGYDLAAGSYSLLSWGLELGRLPRITLAPDDVYHLLRPLLRVAGDHYRKYLNESVLFDAPEIALDCLETLMAAQGIRPDLWSHGSERFEVVRVVGLINPDM